MKVFAYQPSYDRIASRVAEIATDIDDKITPVLIQADGSVQTSGAPTPLDDVQFDVAWASSELFLHGPARDAFRLLQGAKDLKWFQSGAAGFDHPLFARIAAGGTIMTRSDAQGVSIAEYILARVLEVIRLAAESRQLQTQSKWQRQFFGDLYGKTWLIVGMGAIGNATAQRAKAFGTNIIGVRRNPTGREAADKMIRPDEVIEHLPGADIVVLTTPLTDETRHMVNDDFLAAMKPGSIFVNVGRGGLVDEAALLKSLPDNRPATAILDVFETEPLPEDNPLWLNDQVLITSHCAAESPMTWARGDDLFVENLRHYVAGTPMRLVVEGLADE
jgi:phosphoglycerate dehydrogenase-like enzyme